MSLNKPREKRGILTGGPSKRDEAVLDSGAVRMDSVVYDFSVEGGAVGTINLVRHLPENAMVIGLLTEELTAVTGATDIVILAGAVALSGSLDLTADAGIQSRALAGAVAGIKLSASSELNIAIATNPATAGKVRIYVRYVMPNEQLRGQGQ